MLGIRGTKGSVNPLVLRSPTEVLSALEGNRTVKCWLRYIESEYLMPRKDTILFFPCTATKPYQASRSYKILAETLDAVGTGRKMIHLITISEPYGAVPEEFYGERRWNYDCPGLFEWWCRNHGIPYERETVNKCIELIALSVGGFLKRNKQNHRFARVVACVRYCSSSMRFNIDHTHRRILEQASELSSVPVEFVPSLPQIRTIVSRHGTFSWDMYGPAHPTAQERLLSKLEAELDGGT